MMANLKIITPTLEYSKELCELIKESIIMNCSVDYNNDPQVMKKWLANKTPDNISQWIDSENNISLAAFDTSKNQIAGFALMSKNGEILLNYVLSAYLYQGVGKALLNEMEQVARSSRIKALSVVSTITAKNFYERNGFVKNGEPEYVGAILGDFPLIKNLNTK